MYSFQSCGGESISAFKLLSQTIPVTNEDCWEAIKRVSQALLVLECANLAPQGFWKGQAEWFLCILQDGFCAAAR